MEYIHEPTKIMNYLYEKDNENKLCVHCKNSMPKFVSINNSILICSQCYLKHLSLGYNISYVRSIKDPWDPYLLSYLERGGNSRFIKLIKKYNLENLPIQILFNTRIIEYYRLLIKSEVLADEPPDQIESQFILNQIDNSIIYFPEFEDYHIFEGKIIPKVNTTTYLITLFRYIGSGYLNKKINDNDIYGKTLKGTLTLLKGIKEGGKIMYKTSKPIFKYLSIKTIQGIGYLCKKAIDELDESNNDNNGNKCNIDINDFLNVNNYIITPSLEFPTFEEIMMANNNNYNNYNNDFPIDDFNTFNQQNPNVIVMGGNENNNNYDNFINIENDINGFNNNVIYDNNNNLELEFQRKESNVENPIKENNSFVKGETDINDFI
jgi:hypothetical protein